MSGRRRNRTSEKRGRVLLIAGAILALLVLALVIWKLTDRSGEEDPLPPEATPTAAAGLSLPYSLEDGRLEISSVFQYTGDNPDCGDEAGEDVAALVVTNRSDRHLTSARLTAELADGTRLSFWISDVPAGQTVRVFESDNGRYDTANPCVAVTCDAQFEDGSPVPADRLSVSVEETEVTLTNISGEPLGELTLYCHCLLNGAYFGGGTYSYAVEPIPAGGSVTIAAEECYLGEAAVVRVTQG